MAEAYVTQTTGRKFIPELWSNKVLVARENVFFLANRVQRFDAEVAVKGEIIHVPELANLTAGDISTSTGVLDATVNTEGEKTITINKWKGVVSNILDIARAQMLPGYMDRISGKIGFALGLIVETDLAAQAPNLTTNTVGTFQTELTDADFRDAIEKLDGSLTPFTDRFGYFKHTVKNTFLGIDKFVRYDSIPRATGQNPTLKGVIGELYGVPIGFSPLVFTNSSDVSNMIFHRDTFALAMQKKPQMIKFAKTAFTDRIGGSELYGLSEMRDDQGCELRS